MVRGTVDSSASPRRHGNPDVRYPTFPEGTAMHDVILIYGNEKGFATLAADPQRRGHLRRVRRYDDEASRAAER